MGKYTQRFSPNIVFSESLSAFLLQLGQSQNEAGQRLTEFCQEDALVIANTLFQQHKKSLYKWTSSDGQH